MSSSRAPFRLRLTAAQSGIDPRTHYWFKAVPGDYQRLCDNTPWTPQHLPTTDYDVCRRCYRMRKDDQRYGFRAFSLTHKQTGIFARGSEDTLELDEGMVRPITIQTFGKFYAMDTAGREKYIAELRRRRLKRQQQPDKQSGGPHPYSYLENHFRKYHWKTRDIGQLIHRDPELALASHDMSKKRIGTR